MKDDRSKAPQVLSGWKEIANYLGKGVRTVQRYERVLGLPVRRPAGKPWGSVVATKAEIDAWVAASPLREGVQLLREATRSAGSTWASLQSQVEETKKLTKQMIDLQMELNSSVQLLRASLREAKVGLNKEEWRRSIEEQVAQTRSLFNLLRADTGGRKAS